MPEDTTSGTSRRRTFLQSVAAVGVGSALWPTVGGARSQEGGYYQSLQEELTSEEELPEGEFLYGTTEAAVLDTFELSGGDQATETRFEVDGEVPFTIADRLEVNEETENAFGYTYTGGDTGASFEVGDVLLAVAYVRAPGAAAAETPPEFQAQFKYQYTDPDGETSFGSSMVQTTENVRPGGEWQRYYFPIEITEVPDGTDLQPYLEFFTGFGPQTLEFGGIALVDYGQDVSVDELPTTDLDYEYPGRAEDAAWRDAAAERIEEHRKTDFSVEVVDADGEPVEGATVDVEQRQHDFGFGSAVSVGQLPDGSETYRETFLENFNKAVPENGLKVPAWEGRYGESLGPESTRAALDWLDDQGIPTRGHALVWSTYDWMGIDSGLSASEVNAQVVEKIEERATEFAGRLPEWDMHNHPLFYSEIWDDIGREYVLDWWDAAHSADPNAEVYINEMNVLAGDSLRDQYDEHVQWLQDQGADVEGIGFMGHFSLGSLTPPEELLDVFDRFGEFGVPLQLTEFDVQINDRGNDTEVAVQRDYVRDLLTAAFSHPAVEGVMSWGFWAEEHWRPSAAYYGSDWTLRPHGEEFQRLVFEEWRTQVAGETDADGRFDDRGFEGTYEVTATDGETFGTATVTFDDEGAAATVELTEASIGDLDLTVSDHVLTGDESAEIDVGLAAPDGTELPVPDGALSFESGDPDVVAVDDEGVVSVAAGGTATVTVTATAYGDTAVGSARIRADPGPAILDPAEDFSRAESSEGLYVTTFEERHGDGARFEKDAADASGSVTYHVPDGIHSTEVVAYVNNQEIDGEDDVFTDVGLAVSTDGDAFQPVDATREETEAPSDSNGFWALWTYRASDAIPDDATYLRVTIPETQANWSVNVGEVELRSAPPIEESDPDPVVSDPAEDFSLADSSTGVYVGTYEERQGDGAWFEKEAADATGSVTYRIPEGVATFETVAYVNRDEIDGDAFDDLAFEVSADGETFQTIDADRVEREAPNDGNGYWGLWTYSPAGDLPDDATYVRVVVPETTVNWGVNVGAVRIWDVDPDEPTDDTGPAIVVSGLQPDGTYELPRAADVAIGDDDSAVGDSSVTLSGGEWNGGEIEARGRHRLSARAANEFGVTTATEFEFEVVNEDHELIARQNPSETEATYRDRITFDVEDTTGSGHWITDLAWDFDDGSSAEGWWAEHRFDEPGPYTVELTATDNDGDRTTDAVVLWMSDLGELIASADPSATEVAAGERVTFDAVDETDSDGWIDSLAWDFGDGDTASGWWAEHRYDATGEYVVTLTATDNVGRTSTYEVTIAVSE